MSAVKISVLGVGKVGSTAAFILARDGLAAELVLWNRTAAVAQADALDIQQACAFTPHRVEVRAGGVEDTAGSAILLMCASVPTPADMTDRGVLASGNARLVRELIPQFARLSPEAVIVNVANPMDAITWELLRVSGFPWKRVIGTGTLIDSARFRELLSQQVGIHPMDLKAYILGEHGESQFAALSVATAGGEHIDATPARYLMQQEAKDSAFQVLRTKGYTNYAVAAAAALVVESIVRDLRYTLPVSVRIDGFCGVKDVCLSVPAVVGRGGVRFTLRPDLDPREQEAFRQSAAVVRATIEAMG
jgi:L-lactate dehydrogenase